MRFITNRKIIIFVRLVLIGFLLLFSIPQQALAEDESFAKNEAQEGKEKSVYLDFSDDQASYAAQVAALNRGELPMQTEEILQIQPESVGRRGETVVAEPLVAVLCQTDGANIDFALWEPAYIIAGPRNCFTLYFTGEEAADRAVEALSALPGIRYAERDAEVEGCSASSFSFRSWGATRMNFGSYLGWASNAVSGSVTVAVVDSGVYPHAMYADRLLASGYDYIDGDDDATDDPYGHGTNVAGVIADCTQNFPVYLYPIRVLNATGGGTVSNTVNGIREAVEQGVDIINMSLATKNGPSSALDQAVLDAVGAGITVVAAAGNSGIDASQVSPAHLTDAGVIIVGAAKPDGGLESYSNYGSSVDAYVYGTAISCCSNTGGYTNATGTSVAAPHMSGFAALLLLTHAGIGPAEIETRICNATDTSVEVRTPDLLRITPDNPGFHLSLLEMDLQDSYQLSTWIRPLTAMEPVSYQSSDAFVVTIQNGVLTPVGPGTAVVTAECLGMEAIQFTVAVTEDDCGAISLPQSLRRIGQEAFAGASALSAHLTLPASCETVEDGAFDSCEALKTIEMPASLNGFGNNTFLGIVLLCPEGSPSESYAIDHQLNYILISE